MKNIITQLPLLSIIVWSPILSGLFLLAFYKEHQERLVKTFSLFLSIAIFFVSLFLWAYFDSSTANMQFVEKFYWIRSLGVEYYLGTDGISLPLVILTTFATALVVLASQKSITQHVPQYFAAFLIMEGLMNGVFFAQDSMLFYVFWEAMLIPMYLIIGIWGGPNRVYAAIKFFLYTFLGSVLMLVALIYLYNKIGSFEIAKMYGANIPFMMQSFIFWAFFAAFAVKIPMWPVHTWLPDAHVEAPTGGSVILAAIMLKMGGYGFIRFCLPIVPQASLYFAPAIIALSLIAVIYIGFVAIVQTDMKKLIAYSSIAHMGLVTLGFFAVFAIIKNTGSVDNAVLSFQGAMVQMISHGFISAGLFLCVGVLYDRMHTRDIAAYGGVANVMPVFAAFFMLLAMANTGLPGTSGFVGEFMVLLASLQAGFWIAFCAATSLILSAAFTLWMYRKVMFGKVANSNVSALVDITLREKILLSLVAFSVLFFGIWPKPLTDMMQKSSEQIVNIARGAIK